MLQTNPAPLIIPVAPTRAKAKSNNADPIYAAIKARKAAFARFSNAADERDRREAAARTEHGPPPQPFIRWRGHSDIGGSEIERVRDEYLRHAGRDIDAVAAVWAEYRDAKQRYAARLREISEWNRRAGTAEAAKRLDRAIAELRRTETELCETAPTTKAGVAALLRYALDDDFDSDVNWHLAAVEVAAVAVAEMQ